MALVAGADGCKGGWICVTRDTETGTVQSSVCSSAHDLISQAPIPDALCIDIPIGLPDSGSRKCDIAARAFIGPRRSSVFPAPIRSMLLAASYASACAIGLEKDGRKLSKQAWGIVPKIREVDEILRASARARNVVVEVHPEVCFAVWAGAPMCHPKKNAEGHAERRQLVAAHFGVAVLDAILRRYPRSLVAADDVLDAFAALRTAERVATGCSRSLPPAPDRDSCRLPMQIVY